MKIKNKKSLFRDIVKMLPMLAGVVVMIYGVFIIKDIEVSTILPINKVSVSGEFSFIDKNEIELIVENNISGGFFSVDLNRIREILSKRPWVKNVSLRRQWPNVIDVFIEERSPIAYWNSDGYISESGIVFKPESIDKTLNLPVLDGPVGQHNNVLKFMNVLYGDVSLLKYTVTSLKLDERRAWQLKISDNTEVSVENGKEIINVRLGRFDTAKRVQRFLQILPALTSKKEFSENKVKVIDMRYPNGFAVQINTDEA